VALGGTASGVDEKPSGHRHRLDSHSVALQDARLKTWPDAPFSPAFAAQSARLCDTMYLIDLNRERSMAATTMVHVRVDEHIKTQATETLSAMGLTVSDAVRIFLTRVVADQQLPFALKAPNASTRAAMKEARAMSKARFVSASELINELEEAAKQ
jgi:DNA-damage-inducible protein J